MNDQPSQPSSLGFRVNNWMDGQPALGRLPYDDPRDVHYPIRTFINEKLGSISRKEIADEDIDAWDRGWRYWNAEGWWGDQMATPHCVAYSWTHYLEDGPDTLKETAHGLVGGQPAVDPESLYREFQLNDEWEGTDYDGTSVRAGAKVLRARGHIKEYRWGYSLNDVVNAVLLEAPVIMGTDWTMDMFTPDSNKFIWPTGDTVGGHAYLINGVNVDARKFRIKNSWGRRWGSKGHAWITFEALKGLLDEWGEACLAIQR